MNKLAVFDFDSTLMAGETIAIIAGELGLREEVEKATEKAMRGEADFFESLTARAALLKGLPISKVDEINFNSFAVNGVTRLFKTIPLVIPPANQISEIVVKTKNFRRTNKISEKVSKINKTL